MASLDDQPGPAGKNFDHWAASDRALKLTLAATAALMLAGIVYFGFF